MELRLILARHAEDAAYRADRERVGEVVDDVDLALAVELVDEPIDRFLQPGLEVGDEVGPVRRAGVARRGRGQGGASGGGGGDEARRGALFPHPPPATDARGGEKA